MTSFDVVLLDAEGKADGQEALYCNCDGGVAGPGQADLERWTQLVALHNYTLDN